MGRTNGYIVTKTTNRNSPQKDTVRPAVPSWPLQILLDPFVVVCVSRKLKQLHRTGSSESTTKTGWSQCQRFCQSMERLYFRFHSTLLIRHTTLHKFALKHWQNRSILISRHFHHVNVPATDSFFHWSFGTAWRSNYHETTTWKSQRQCNTIKGKKSKPSNIDIIIIGCRDHVETWISSGRVKRPFQNFLVGRKNEVDFIYTWL